VPEGPNQIAGKNTILAGRLEKRIDNEKVKTSSKIILTPLTTIDTQLAVIKKIDGEGFIVGISQPSFKDIPFDWLIIDTYSTGPIVESSYDSEPFNYGPFIENDQNTSEEVIIVNQEDQKIIINTTPSEIIEETNTSSTSDMIPGEIIEETNTSSTSDMIPGEIIEETNKESSTSNLENINLAEPEITIIEPAPSIEVENPNPSS
jgi:acetylornithine/succinyldiaminopimelate/putrescine aminotransferase